jgi:hypothetical protein
MLLLLQERLMFELRNVRDLNQRLGHLAKRPTAHPDNSSPDQLRSDDDPSSERRISRLQDQNRMLTEEVGRKSQLITALEEEKRALIRQLFQQSSSMPGSTDTIKSNSSLKSSGQPPQTYIPQSHIPQPQKLGGVNKTFLVDVKKIC